MRVRNQRFGSIIIKRIVQEKKTIETPSDLFPRRCSMNERHAKRTAIMVVMASWLAVFCLFGFRATFAVLKVPMGKDMHWSAANISAGYALMMMVYAVSAFFSGMIIDRWGTRPAYFLAAIFGALGFWVTSRVDTLPAYYAAYGILGG